MEASGPLLDTYNLELGKLYKQRAGKTPGNLLHSNRARETVKQTGRNPRGTKTPSLDHVQE